MCGVGQWDVGDAGGAGTVGWRWGPFELVVLRLVLRLYALLRYMMCRWLIHAAVLQCEAAASPLNHMLNRYVCYAKLH